MGQSHSILRTRVASALEQRGWLVIPYPSTGYTGPGTADILAVVPPEGWTVVVEVKTWGDKPVATDIRWIKQQRFLRRVRKAGGISVWGYSVQEILDKIDQEVETKRRDLRREVLDKIDQ